MSNKLDATDVKKAWHRSMSYQWLSFSYETMQSPGFTYIMLPALRKLYGDDVAAEKADKYITAFYNTENTMGQIIHGAVLGLEEGGDEGVTDTSVALRTGLMGPFAGLGDSIFKVSFKVIFGSLAGYMALENSAVGLILCLILGFIISFPIRKWFFYSGYKQGVEFITTKQDLIQGLTQAVTIMGLVVVGTMIPSTVKVTTPLVYTNGDATKAIQDILDAIFPYLLPVLVTLGVYKAIGNKKITTVRMVWIIIVLCIILTFFGIL